jgi:hypothetical protein
MSWHKGLYALVLRFRASRGAEFYILDGAEWQHGGARKSSNRAIAWNLNHKQAPEHTQAQKIAQKHPKPPTLVTGIDTSTDLHRRPRHAQRLDVVH